MGYERNNPRGDRPYRPEDRDNWRGHAPRGYDEDRGFLDRAGDEVRSWFGDEEAERRRRLDERDEQEQEARYGGRSDSRYRPGAVSGGGYGSYRAGSADYGAGRGAGATSNWGLGAGQDRNDWGHDPNYHAWRSRQLEQFDRDYADYRREHQSRFDSDFGGWRQTRQTQRDSLRTVQPHQEVVGSDGEHVGTVDKVRGDRIILTRTDSDASGHHHSIPIAWIVRVGDKVEINQTAQQAKAVWRDEEQNSAFWGDDAGDYSAARTGAFSGQRSRS